MGESGLNLYDEIIDDLLDFDQWYYCLDIILFIEVLDICMQCWCSEFNMNKFLGLMDWEVLCDFQYLIIGKEFVIVVFVVFIYGVKVIEVI